MYELKQNPTKLLLPADFNKLDQAEQKDYIKSIGYPGGRTGDLILVEVFNELDDQLKNDLLSVVIVLIEDIIQCPIKFITFLQDDSGNELSASQIIKSNKTCVFCGAPLESLGLVFCDRDCVSNMTRKGNLIRLLTYDNPIHPTPDEGSRLPFYACGVYKTDEYEYYKSLLDRKKKSCYRTLVKNQVHGIYDSIKIKSSVIVDHIGFLKCKRENSKMKKGDESKFFDRKFESFLFDNFQQLSMDQVIITNLNSEFSALFYPNNSGDSEDVSLIERKNRAWSEFHKCYWKSDKQILLFEVRFDELLNQYRKHHSQARRDMQLINHKKIVERIKELLENRQNPQRKIPKVGAGHLWRISQKIN
jgi:hypothetical protein